MAGSRDVRSKHNPTRWPDQELVDRLVRRYGDDGLVPTREQWEKMLASPEEGPVIMLSLFKLHAFAHYKHQKKIAVTGFEAFGRYVQHVTPILQKHGVKVMFSAQVDVLLIGNRDDEWDSCAAVHYPSARVFFGVWLDPAYAPAKVHKRAAIALSSQFTLTSFPAG
jgi:uncharacterized protein (DUF1330 family)